VETEPAALTGDILGGSDGPHRETAEAFLAGTLCEDCWAEPATADPTERLGPACLARILEAPQTT
jgi:hypothetical protein